MSNSVDKLQQDCVKLVHVNGNQIEHIAKRIKVETKPRYTQGDIAIRLGISRPALSRSISGTRKWRYAELETIATMFGITVQELVGESGENATSVTNNK